MTLRRPIAAGFSWVALFLVMGAACRSGATLTESTPTGTAPTTASATASPAASPSATATSLFGTFTPTRTPTVSARQVQVYRNDTYGYSFSVACPPFCQISDTAIDVLRAVSTDGRNAWIEARVYDLSTQQGGATLPAFHDTWKGRLLAEATDFKELGAKDTLLVDRKTPALVIAWTAQSAGAEQGGLQASTVLTVNGPLGYALATRSEERRVGKECRL